MRLLRQPLAVLVAGAGALAMLPPSAYALSVGDHATARAFFYSAVLFLVLIALTGIAVGARAPRQPGRSHLLALLFTFAVLPLMLAVPFAEAVPDTRYVTAYFEMVSSITTTGASFYAPDRLPGAVHLWRAEVAWLGGFFVWVVAVAIFAPMSLGGFEVRETAWTLGRGAVQSAQIARVADVPERLVRFSVTLLPVYVGLTLALWAALVAAGDANLTAICHAMSTMATSGISPVGGVDEARSGFAGEALAALFLVFALSRLTFAADERPAGWRSVGRDPELRFGLAIVGAVTLFLVLRHWIGSIEVASEGSFFAILQTSWGAAFTALSFLTTTGFESGYWDLARNWSGLTSPGLLLMGLAVFGGGVATTAGGVKLLRVYALYRHGVRELDRLVHPHSVGGAGPAARRIRRQGAQVAWIFFMLFAVSIAVLMLAFSATGETFEDSLILTVASLTTTGPLVGIVGEEPVQLTHLTDAGRLVFAAAMIVGRLETLVLIALLNPDFWRS